MMQIPSCRFHCAGSIVQVPLCRFPCADSIIRRLLLIDLVRIPSRRFDHADFIVQIILCGFLHAPSIVSIERIPSSALQHSIVRMRIFLSCPLCGFHGTGSIVQIPYKLHCADFVVRMLLCAFHCTHSVVCILSCASYRVHSILCFPSCDRRRTEEGRGKGGWGGGYIRICSWHQPGCISWECIEWEFIDWECINQTLSIRLFVRSRLLCRS